MNRVNFLAIVKELNSGLTVTCDTDVELGVVCGFNLKEGFHSWIVVEGTVFLGLEHDMVELKIINSGYIVKMSS